MSGYAYDDWERDEVLPFVPTSAASVLDVGCSFGGFGGALKRRRPGLEVWGLEPHSDAAEKASERLDRVVNGLFPQDAPDRRFDCVVFNDVLEHLPDPWEALRATKDLVAEGGAVVASIPNVRHFSVVVPLVLRGRFAYRDVGILDRTHLRFFTRSTMIELFESTGWRVDRIEPTRLSPPSDGEIPRLLSLFGRRADELRAKNYVVVASPVAPSARS
ncbi:MAG: class I SAM-dependent methyltransferase [Acidimicrobiia bacterium]